MRMHLTPAPLAPRCLHRQAAAGSKRDVKKALQQLGRQRPDILPQLPQPLVARLAAVQLEPAALAERKTGNAFARITAAAAAPGGLLGRASTQDVLRVLWVVSSSSSSNDGKQDNAGEHVKVAARGMWRRQYVLPRARLPRRTVHGRSHPACRACRRNCCSGGADAAGAAAGAAAA